MSESVVRSRRMGFKHAMLQRSYEMSPSPARTSPTNANSTTSSSTNSTTNECPPAVAQAPAQVTDFSISRILGKERRSSPTDATANILDLSKSGSISTSHSTQPQGAPQVPPTIAASPSYMGYSMLPPDLVAMANATKFYAQFFPHLLPAYAAAAAAAGLSTPPTSPYQQQQLQQHHHQQQKRYFAPYVINGQAPQQQQHPNLIRPKATATACTRPDCLECLDYYQKLQAGYKSTPLISPAASSVSSSSSSAMRPVRDLVNSTSISLTTVTNFSMNTAQTAAGLMPKMDGLLPNAVGMGSNISSSRSSSINPINPYNPTAAEEISYKCRICEKVFGCSETLQAHEKTHKSPRYECSDCGKGFSQLRNYKYHLSVHRGTKEFAAECPECGKTFNDKGYLSSHMKIHRNRKEYECPYCPKSFNQRVAFNMHVRIHTGVKPHKCSECGKRFSRKMLLKQHMRTHSGEKPYQCSVCGKSFADRSNMTLHHRLHSGIKPFSCPLCPKAFTKKHHLKTHLNYHTGCKPYVCLHPNCNQAFTQSSNMRTHAKKCQYRPLDSTPSSYPVPGKAQPQGQMQMQVPTSLALAMASAPTFAMPPPPPPAQQSLLSNLRTY
ncbi:gastrula zinc finger protein XlCGF53.1 [Drosophila pseudoobscura]|uniref:Gastrula zinc finger protein XlCGF53.1 n=1 Tax=Drosophila pseudoobscura pseudoobscura TaxID=46245 RepID=A0A6I8VXQ8_DROPS|nr:gastrula zinc finger protein XlCGF53.1 [Drosophila pseudoobscura]